MFAEVNLSLGTIFTWLVIGLGAGWLVARVMKVGGFGQFGYMIVGMVGAVIGGLAYRFVEVGEAGFWGSIVVAVVGAHLLIALFRFMGFKRRDT
jgi:uncharacterized membrane protein YeaQ/YmgE (transglycosylase-associated protein family)